MAAEVQLLGLPGIGLIVAALAVAALLLQRRRLHAQQRKARQADESLRFLHALVDAIPTPILVKDERHRYVAANAAFCAFFQRDLGAIQGKTDYDFFPPEDAAFFQATDSQALNGERVEYERT
jgi:PAS domain-containing protein